MKILYLHGFASGPSSKKGMAVAARFPGVTRLDLRVPSLEHLSLRAMIATTRAMIGGDGPVTLIGSSLGGLTAARAAEGHPQVTRLVLLAPAFHFADRWRARLGPDGWAAWMDTGWLEVADHTRGGAMARVHADFAREAAAIDIGWPDVRVPTLILHGIRDDVVPIDTSRELAARSAHVRLVELDDDHELLATLAQTLDEIAQFLAPEVRGT